MTAILALTIIVLASVAPGLAAGGDSRAVADGQQAVVATIRVGDGPHGIVVNESNDDVYVANLNNSTVSVIDGQADVVRETIQVRDSPRDVAIGAAQGRLYVAHLGAYRLSPVRRRLLGLLSVRLYEASFAASVVDVTTGHSLDEIEVGTNPWLVESNPSSGRTYVANYGGHSVSVVDEETNEVIETIELGTLRIPGCIAISEGQNRVYVTATSHLGPVDFGRGQLLVFNGETNRPLESWPAARWAHVAVSESAGLLYLTNPEEGTLSVLDGETGETRGIVGVGAWPSAVAVDEQAGHVYVANRGENTVSIVDTEAYGVIQTVPVGVSPQCIAVNPRSGKVYVSNSSDDTVSVLTSEGLTRR
jgi:YVTN family beta-propeller protein